MKVKVPQSCPTLRDPTEYTVHGILQARILEWITTPFSRASSQPRDQTQVSFIAEILYQLSHWESPRILGFPIPSPGGLPNPVIEPGSPVWQADSLPAELSGKPFSCLGVVKFWDLGISSCRVLRHEQSLESF